MNHFICPFYTGKLMLDINSSFNPTSSFCWFGSRMPFDWKTPLGYLIAYLSGIPVIYYIIRFSTCTMTFPAASCGIMIAFSKDIRAELAAINQQSKNRENDAKVMKKVCEIVGFHSVARQLSCHLLQSALVNLWPIVSSFFSDSPTNLVTFFTLFSPYTLPGRC